MARNYGFTHRNRALHSRRVGPATLARVLCRNCDGVISFPATRSGTLPDCLNRSPYHRAPVCCRIANCEVGTESHFLRLVGRRWNRGDGVYDFLVDREGLAGNVQAIGRFPNRDLRENECTSVPDVQCAANALAKFDDAPLGYAPPVLAGVAAVWIIWQILHRRFLRREAFLTFLAAWSALFYCQVLTRSDPVHLLITLPPFFILLAYGRGDFRGGFLRKEIREDMQLA
jgi:hypothetical protein